MAGVVMFQVVLRTLGMGWSGGPVGGRGDGHGGPPPDLPPLGGGEGVSSLWEELVLNPGFTRQGM
ncbi:MAG: hypothetical protein ACH37Z_16025, partial [Anaerolineae bacterium]